MNTSRLARFVFAFLFSIALVTGCATTPNQAQSPPSSAPAATQPSQPLVGPRAQPEPSEAPTKPNGIILPNRKLTPGATDPRVTQSNIHSTICVSGYTKTVRPPSSYTTDLKKQQLADGYTYNGSTNTRDYEEDHQISLELGGAPTDPKNLWPEPYASSTGARVKDKLENKLHQMICSGQISLATAQHAIAKNWWAAYET